MCETGVGWYHVKGGHQVKQEEDVPAEGAPKEPEPSKPVKRDSSKAEYQAFSVYVQTATPSLVSQIKADEYKNAKMNSIPCAKCAAK